MERADGNNPKLPLDDVDPCRHPSRGPVRRRLGCLRQWQDGHPHRASGSSTTSAPRQFAQNSSGNPPDTFNRAIYYSTVDKIPSLREHRRHHADRAGGTVGNQTVQENYNGTFMIQQRVGFGTVLEAAYVFNLSKHMWVTRQLNAVAPVLRVQPRQQQPERGLSARQHQRQEPSTTIISVRSPAWVR